MDEGKLCLVRPDLFFQISSYFFHLNLDRRQWIEVNLEVNLQKSPAYLLETKFFQ